MSNPKYMAKAAFAFGGKTYSEGDEFNSDNVIKMLLEDLIERHLIAVQPVIEDTEEDA